MGAALAVLLATKVITLQEAVQTAQKQQPTVREAQANAEAGVGARDQALSTLLPGIYAQASYQLRTTNSTPTPGINTSGGGASAAEPFTATINGMPVMGTLTLPTATAGGARAASFTPSNFTSLSTGISQLIWDFQSVDRYRASRANERALLATVEGTRLLAELNAETYFFQARANRALALVGKQTVENQRKHLTQVEGFVSAGTQPEIALAQQRSALATAEVQLIQAESNYTTSKALLNQAMGVEQGTDYEVADEALPQLAGEDDPVDALVDEALKARPEFKSYKEQVEAQRLTVRAARGGYFPSLTANASFNTQGVDSNFGWNFTYVGVALSWFSASPGFAPLSVLGAVKQQEAQLKNVEAQLEAVRLQVRVDVETARLAVNSGKSQVVAARDALTNANEQLRLAEGRYQTGVGSIIELGDAQVAETQAAAQEVQAEFTLATARAQLLRSLGRPFPTSK